MLWRRWSGVSKLLTSCRESLRVFNKNKHKDELDLVVHVQLIHQPWPPHPQPLVMPRHQPWAGTQVMNPSTFSKQQPRLAVLVVQVEVVVEAVGLLVEAQILLALALAWVRQLGQVPKVELALEISISYATIPNSSSYVKSSRLSRVCLSPFYSKSVPAIHNWRA